MEQYTESMLTSHAFHDRHEQHVVIDRQVCLLKNRRQLKLVRCHLVVSGLAWNAEFKRHDFKLLHERRHTFRD